MISDIRRTIEERKNELNSILNKKQDLTPEIKHQIYGAINEINIFLRVLSYYRNLEIDREIKELKLVKPAKKNAIKDFFNRRNVKDVKQNSE